MYFNWNNRRQQRTNSPFSQMEAQMQSFRGSVRPMVYTHQSLEHEIQSMANQSRNFIDHIRMMSSSPRRMSDLPVIPGPGGMEDIFAGRARGTTDNREQTMSVRSMSRSSQRAEGGRQEIMETMMTAFQPLLPFGTSLMDEVLSGFSDSMMLSDHRGVEHGRTQRRPGQQRRARNVHEITHPLRRGDHRIENDVDFANRNTHPFPPPDQNRTTWYDPDEPTPETRLPNIPPRFLTLAQIGRIPTRKITETEGSCDICLDNYKQGDTAKVLNCKHDYHTACVDPWLKQHTTCPKCRRQVCAPPEKSRRPPRPPPPVSLRRERARAYDVERRARERGVLGEVVDGNHGIGSSETEAVHVTLPRVEPVSSSRTVHPVPVAVVVPFVDSTVPDVLMNTVPELIEEDVV